MGRLIPYIIAGIAVVLVLDQFTVFPGAALSAINLDAVPSMSGADRSAKGNRLVAPRREDSRSGIAAVEIVGLRDTAIVYRDREGRLLFRNDPATNTTVVAKNVVLPEVTVRDHNGGAVRPTPVGIEVPQNTRPPKLPMGCDPAFGPLADPSVRVLTGRCLTSNPGVQKFAAPLVSPVLGCRAWLLQFPRPSA
jgi:hypothetical protein